MELAPEVARGILDGERPEGKLAGVTLDGKRLPRRERVLPWRMEGVDLRGAILTRLDLSDACFREADLSGAVFRNVNLHRADFTRCSAAGAVFEDVNLTYANFREADLRGAALTFANLADIGFKEADLRGAAVNAVRFSLNGGTHSLGLKEALGVRYGPVSYPFVTGVSGDAFWLSYSTEGGTLTWGDSVRPILEHGLSACGFEWEFANQMDAEDAWRLLCRELTKGHGVITPVHVGGPAIGGSAFGGSEWVYVSEYDSEADAVSVRCLLGDDLRFEREEFVANWCLPHPLERVRERRAYTYCVAGARKELVPKREAIRRGIEFGLTLLDRGEVPGAICGIPVYDFLLRDLGIEPSRGEEGCLWIGLGLRHLHGSRWAIRDFLREAREHMEGETGALIRAIEHYEGVLADLSVAIRLLPDSLSRGGDRGDEDRRRFLANRDEAAGRLRSARGGEERGRDALRELLGA